MSRKDIERRKKFVLELMGDPIYQPMRFREISSLLRLSKEEKKDLYDVLDELCDEGKVSVDHKGRYEKDYPLIMFFCSFQEINFFLISHF